MAFKVWGMFGAFSGSWKTFIRLLAFLFFLFYFYDSLRLSLPQWAPSQKKLLSLQFILGHLSSADPYVARDE